MRKEDLHSLLSFSYLLLKDSSASQKFPSHHHPTEKNPILSSFYSLFLYLRPYTAILAHQCPLFLLAWTILRSWYWTPWVGWVEGEDWEYFFWNPHQNYQDKGHICIVSGWTKKNYVSMINQKPKFKNFDKKVSYIAHEFFINSYSYFQMHSAKIPI